MLIKVFFLAICINRLLVCFCVECKQSAEKKSKTVFCVLVHCSLLLQPCRPHHPLFPHLLQSPGQDQGPAAIVVWLDAATTVQETAKEE